MSSESKKQTIILFLTLTMESFQNKRHHASKHPKHLILVFVAANEILFALSFQNFLHTLQLEGFLAGSESLMKET